MNTQFATSNNLNSTAFSGETARFREVVKRYLHAGFRDRDQLFAEVSKYIKFSPNWSELVNDLILSSTASEDVEDRLDAAVDVLHQFPKICDYAWGFLIQDIRNYNAAYSGRAYKPNDDYWHILLKSVAGSNASVGVKLNIIGKCKGATSRAIKEIVLESLDEIDHPDAIELIRSFVVDSDPMISELAIEILDN